MAPRRNLPFGRVACGKMFRQQAHGFRRLRVCTSWREAEQRTTRQVVRATYDRNERLVKEKWLSSCATAASHPKSPMGALNEDRARSADAFGKCPPPCPHKFIRIRLSRVVGGSVGKLGTVDNIFRRRQWQWRWEPSFWSIFFGGAMRLPQTTDSTLLLATDQSGGLHWIDQAFGPKNNYVLRVWGRCSSLRLTKWWKSDSSKAGNRLECVIVAVVAERTSRETTFLFNSDKAWSIPLRDTRITPFLLSRELYVIIIIIIISPAKAIS